MMKIPTQAFPIRKGVVQKYALADATIIMSGDIAENHATSRTFTAAINAHKKSDDKWSAGEINALALINDINRQILAFYEETQEKRLFSRAYQAVSLSLGSNCVSQGLDAFMEEYFGYRSADGASEELRESVLISLLYENVENMRYAELFSDPTLNNNQSYLAIKIELEKFLETCSPFADTGLSILNFLRIPIKRFPLSLYDRLLFISRQWKSRLSNLYKRILTALDFMREEYKGSPWGGGGSGRSESHDYSSSIYEPEAFANDTHWMTDVVMIAKNALVWLYQLRRRYNDDSIVTLADIPEIELEKLAKAGINALWLIGIWRRSHASKRIKNIMGNPEAESSAYSLDTNEVDNLLGGEAALGLLRAKAAKHGIRLASDMVPNHTAMDSDWVANRPNLFMQAERPPFPSYKFNGENLSARPDVQIFLEDGYYGKSDAATVFKRVDARSGHTRYIYHGNDGTAMPWNDTAQLDFLNPEAREAVIQEIIKVARNFPIIRFDAAMTLVKRHIRRLWYPAPGQGGAIPGRSDYAMSDAEFDKAIPVEFWREAVDRVNAEAPDTLLLAEAFWMLEGYFVRSLGMHRVYNSAFMNMLKDEENAKYRATIKNTQEFDLEILKRFVNFMSNPDEETAIDQFGSGDKYFGVCATMSAMPGLPMFAHGQIEGLTEKYGMEYSRAYYDENPDDAFIKRHEREIFPILRNRGLFSHCYFFRLYDFITPQGVNENVFSHSNAMGLDKSLFFYNNSYGQTEGAVRDSAPFTVKQGGKKELRTQSLASALGITGKAGRFLTCTNLISGAVRLAPADQVINEGFRLYLAGYAFKVYVNFREWDDPDGLYYDLWSHEHDNEIDRFEERLYEKRYTAFYQACDPILGIDNGLLRLFPSIFFGLISITSETLRATAQEVESACAMSAGGDLSFSGDTFVTLATTLFSLATKNDGLNWTLSSDSIMLMAEYIFLRSLINNKTTVVSLFTMGALGNKLKMLRKSIGMPYEEEIPDILSICLRETMPVETAGVALKKKKKPLKTELKDHHKSKSTKNIDEFISLCQLLEGSLLKKPRQSKPKE